MRAPDEKQRSNKVHPKGPKCCFLCSGCGKNATIISLFTFATYDTGPSNRERAPSTPIHASIELYGAAVGSLSV